MLILDFTKQYYLHDSLIEEIHYNAEQQKLTLRVDFCYWMQDDYIDTDPETGIIYLTFRDVPEYEGIKGQIDCYSILDFIFDSRTITINVLDDYHDVFYELRFKANSVDVSLEPPKEMESW